MAKPSITLTARLDGLPPIFTRAFAKTGGRLATDNELMAKTGWGLKKLRSVYQAISWKDISVGDIDTFHAACGTAWNRQRRYRWLLKIALQNGGIETMRHMRVRSGWQASQVRNLCRRIEKLMTS